jgi:ribosomal protein L16 Arg81 hydroxylase
MEDSSDKQPDIKEFIKYLHKQLGIIEKDMHISKQDYEQIRNEERSYDVLIQEETNNIANRILDDIEKVEREFKNLISEEKSESSFIKQQIGGLTQEKMKIEQNCLLLGTRINEVEKNIGIELRLPSIEKAK